LLKKSKGILDNSRQPILLHGSMPQLINLFNKYSTLFFVSLNKNYQPNCWIN
jgi:hypothetical protein